MNLFYTYPERKLWWYSFSFEIDANTQICIIHFCLFY